MHFEFVHEDGQWFVFCPACTNNNKGGKIHVGPDKTLKNFQRHLGTSAHQTNLESMKDVEAKKAERVVAKEEEKRSKKLQKAGNAGRNWVKPFASQGMFLI